MEQSGKAMMRTQIQEEAGSGKEGMVHFGYRLVPAEQKAVLVRKHFDQVAPKYDFMNTLLSLGAHLLWKRWTVEALGLRTGELVLDLCGGTGDMALLAAARLGPRGRAVICDINMAMMEKARKKASRSARGDIVRFLQADAQAVGLKAGVFDAAIVAFGIRNLTDMEQGFREIFRLLRPAGRMACLEFSTPTTPWFRWLYDMYSFHIMPALGKLLAGSKQAYTYLPESIRVFPGPDKLSRILEQVGFREVRYRRVTDGVACIHLGTKPL